MKKQNTDKIKREMPQIVCAKCRRGHHASCTSHNCVCEVCAAEYEQGPL